MTTYWDSLRDMFPGPQPPRRLWTSQQKPGRSRHKSAAKRTREKYSPRNQKLRLNSSPTCNQASGRYMRNPSWALLFDQGIHPTESVTIRTRLERPPCILLTYLLDWILLMHIQACTYLLLSSIFGHRHISSWRRCNVEASSNRDVAKTSRKNQVLGVFTHSSKS